MTEGENEDSDPGGTSVLRVTCIEYVFGLKSIFRGLTRLNTLSTVERRMVEQLKKNLTTNELKSVVTVCE